MIYVSTGGFRGKTAPETCSELLSAGVKSIELSGGAYSATMLDDLRKLMPAVRFQVHNYFPPPELPFVLNLGSLDDTIGNRSIAHIEQALEYCAVLGANRYSFHAGFLIDPKVDELGRRIQNRTLFDRQKSIEVFVARVLRLAGIAETAGVSLMIENNVLSAKNANEFPSNPLLMCDPVECREIMKLLPSKVGLLVDVAHLKVSAHSLKFNATQMFELCNERIAGYHLSDNNGLEDSNRPFDENAWFWPHLERRADYFTIEVYGENPDQLVKLADLAQSKLRLS